jgi:hypothetical protein
MRKLLFAALLSLAGVGLSTGQASAWLFCHHCCSGSATLCVKPYNAFSPSCFGTIACDGCFPVSFGNHGPYPPWAYGGGPGCCPPAWDACCPSLGCAMDGAGCGSCLPGAAPPGPTTGAPTTLPPASVPAFQAPPPSPMPNGPTTGARAWPYPVQSAGYRGPSAYYPGYAPLPWMQPMNYPASWNGANPIGR